MPQRENSVGPSDLSFMEKHVRPGFMRKKKGDVELPNERRQKDPRLKTKADEIKEGFSIFKGLGKK